mmetsp:Transcript_31209/g.79124  ORF Transcript_31209/g.79124 Transcript_31209/m.79124 type:complete len:1071 (+) Transcript_31209:5803-9015(+)
MADRELVVEVDGSLAEGLRHLVVQLEGGLDELVRKLLVIERRIELLEVPLEERAEDGHERLAAREANGKDHEMALETRVDDKGAAGGVHGAHKLHVLDDAKLQLGHVVPVLVVHVLPEQRDGVLGLVGVELRHVEVVDKVDQAEVAGGAKVAPRLLLEGRLEDGAEARAVRVVVEVCGEGHVVLGEGAQLAVDHGRLAGAREADEERGVAELDEEVEEEGDGLGLAGGDRHRVHGRGRVVRDGGDHLGPRRELERGLVDKEVKDGPLGRHLDLGPLLLPPRAVVLAHVHAVGDGEARAKGPHACKHKVGLEDDLLVGEALGQVLWGVEAVEDASEGLHHVEVEGGLQHVPKLLLEGEEGVWDVCLEQLKHHLLALGAVVVAAHHPRLDKVPPLLDLGDEEHAGARGGGGRGVLEVAELKDEAHVGLHDDALVGGEGQELVVVHDAVHALDPVGVEVAVQDDPLGVGARGVGVLAEQQREDAVLPLPGGEVDVAVELGRRDGLGVEVLDRRLEAPLAVGGGEDLPAGRLARPGGSHDKVAVAHGEQLHQLHRLEQRLLLGLQARLDKALLNLLLQVPVALAGDVDAGEEVAEEAHEDDQVVADNLGQVEVAQRAEQEGELRLFGLGALEVSGDAEHALDGAEAPVVVHRLGEEVAAEGVEVDELDAEHLGHREALRHEHVLGDEGKVGHDDGDGAEEHLERLGEGGAANVPGVHRDVGPARHVELELGALEDKGLAPRDDGVEDRLVLRGADREHLGDEAVELVEATPRPRGAEALPDVAHRLVVHLRGAVEDVDALCEHRAEVLGRLRLARPGGPRRGGAQAEGEGRGDGHVTTVSEGGDDEAAVEPHVLVPVHDASRALLDHAVVERLVPVEAQLALPGELADVHDGVADELVHDVARVHVDDDLGVYLLAHQLLEVGAHLLDQVVDLALELGSVGFHGVLVPEAHPVEHVFDLPGPPDLDARLAAHAQRHVHPLEALVLGVEEHRLLHDGPERHLHLNRHCRHPRFHRALHVDHRAELERLALGRDHALDDAVVAREDELGAVVEELEHVLLDRRHVRGAEHREELVV